MKALKSFWTETRIINADYEPPKYMKLLASYIFASQIVTKYEWYQLLEKVKIVLLDELRLLSSTSHYW